jgi:hypothetical protein
VADRSPGAGCLDKLGRLTDRARQVLSLLAVRRSNVAIAELFAAFRPRLDGASSPGRGDAGSTPAPEHVDIPG